MIDMVGLVLSLVHRTPSSSMYSDEKASQPNSKHQESMKYKHSDMQSSYLMYGLSQHLKEF